MFEMNGVQKGASLLTLNHLRSSSRAKVALLGFRAFSEPPSVKASEVGENKNGCGTSRIIGPQTGKLSHGQVQKSEPWQMVRVRVASAAAQIVSL